MKVIKKKFPMGVDENLVKELEAASVDELKNKLATQNGYVQEVQAFLKADYENLDQAQHAGAQKLKDMKEAYDEAAGPSRDAVKGSRNRIKLIVEQLRKNGAL